MQTSTQENMHFRHYRLAAPIDNNEAVETKTLVLYRPVLSRLPSNRSRLLTSNDAAARTRVVLLNDAKRIEKPAAVAPHARWWLVLPPLALVMFVTSANPLLMTDLLEYRYKKFSGSHKLDENQGTGCHRSTSTPMLMHYWPFPPRIQQPSQHGSDYNHVQSAVSKFNIKNSLITLFPALVIFILLGSNCDVIGRRPLLLLPFVGKIIYNSLMLIIIVRDMSDAWLLVSHALDAGFGSHGLVMLSALAYISDCTSKSDRTRAFFILEVTMVVTRVAPMLALGLWLRYHPHMYIVHISVFLVLSVIGLLYVMFIQPESVKNV
jgi:hypothetical protein